MNTSRAGKWVCANALWSLRWLAVLGAVGLAACSSDGRSSGVAGPEGGEGFAPEPDCLQPAVVRRGSFHINSRADIEALVPAGDTCLTITGTLYVYN
jgi:hypothetical protein